MAAERPGHALFRAWMDQSPLTQVQLGKQLGTSQASISKWYQGTQAPEPGYWQPLEQLCKIPISAWLPPPPAERPRPVRATEPTTSRRRRRRASTGETAIPDSESRTNIPAPETRQSREKAKP
jgi:transcriptional regulator with XRE-family HTH domain